MQTGDRLEKRTPPPVVAVVTKLCSGVFRGPVHTCHSFNHTFNVIWLAPLHKKGGSKLWEVTLRSHSSKCKTYTPHVHFVCIVQCALRNVLIWLCSVQRYCVQLRCVRRCCVQRCSRFVKHVRTTRGLCRLSQPPSCCSGGKRRGGWGGYRYTII